MPSFSALGLGRAAHEGEEGAAGVWADLGGGRVMRALIFADCVPSVRGLGRREHKGR